MSRDVYTTAESVLAQAEWLCWPYVCRTIPDESGWRAFAADATAEQLANARDWLRAHARALEVFDEWDRREQQRRTA
jgi:hypothetical protein